MIVKFNTPQKLNGSEITELELNLAPLKGKDITELCASFNTLYKDYVPVPTIDFRFQAMVAGVAAHVNPRDLEELDASEYLKVCGAVRDFLNK